MFKRLAYLGSLILAAATFFSAFFLLRSQLVAEHNLPYINAAVQKQIYIGLLGDAAIISFCFAIAFLLYGACKISFRITALPLIGFTFLATYSNLLYFKFFLII